MPAVAVWTDTTADHKYTTAGNWLPAAVPAGTAGDGDILIFNDQAVGPMYLEVDAANVGAKHHDIIVDASYQYYIGTSGDPFETQGDGGICFPTIIFSGSGITPSYFNTDAARTSTQVYCDTKSAAADVLVLGGAGSWGNVILRNGKMKVDSTTVTGRIQLLSTQQNAKSILNLPVGSTLTGVEAGVMGGEFKCASDIPIVTVSGGQFTLDGIAAISTRLEMYAGTTYWDASSAASIIALAEIFGGTLSTRQDRTGRVLTNSNVYGTGLMDFSIGGINMTFTNPPRVYGANPVRMPQGTTFTFGL